ETENTVSTPPQRHEAARAEQGDRPAVLRFDPRHGVDAGAVGPEFLQAAKQGLLADAMAAMSPVHGDVDLGRTVGDVESDLGDRLAADSGDIDARVGIGEI